MHYNYFRHHTLFFFALICHVQSLLYFLSEATMHVHTYTCIIILNLDPPSLIFIKCLCKLYRFISCAFYMHLYDTWKNWEGKMRIKECIRGIVTWDPVFFLTCMRSDHVYSVLGNWERDHQIFYENFFFFCNL